MFVDYHTHHYRCGHATGNLLDYAQQAIRIGLAEIGFSDHAPIYHFGNNHHVLPKTAMSWYELPRYVREALSVKQAMQNNIQIRVGIESDYIPGLEEHYRKLWDEYPLDYRTGSVHWLGRWSIFSKHLPPGRTAEYVLNEYLETTQSLARSGVYDIIAHMDCLKTMGLFSSTEVTRLLENTVAVLAQTGMVVEFNTSGWRKDIAEAYPSGHLLRLLAESGVGVTLGSDAHRPQDVGSGFQRAAQDLWAAGFRELTTFRNRKRGTLALNSSPANDISA